MMSTVAEIQLLATHEVAALLGLSEATLRFWRHRRQGPPYVKCGEAVRYRLSDLELWLSEHTVSPEKDSN